CLAFSPDGTALAAGDAGHRVILWDLATGRPSRPPLVQPGIVHGVSFGPGGRGLVVHSDAGAGGRVARLWGPEARGPLRPEIAPDGAWHIFCPPDGTRMMLTMADRIRFVETRTGGRIGEPYLVFHEQIRQLPVGGPAASVSDSLAVVGTGKGMLRLFDAT